MEIDEPDRAGWAVGRESRPGDGRAARRTLTELLGGLLLWLLFVAVVSSLASPWIWRAADELFPGLISHRLVFRRVATVAALLFLWLWTRRLGISSWVDLGWTPRRDGPRRLGLGAALGAAALIVFLAVELVLGSRALTTDWRVSRAALLLVGAAVAGVLEETVFRGALLVAFRDLGRRAFLIALAANSALYATAHFARGGRRLEEVDWASGLRVWLELPASLLRQSESWLGLFVFGVLLGLLAWRERGLWLATGFHIGAVAALGLVGLASDAYPDPGRSTFFADGLLPGLPLALLALVPALWLLREKELRPQPERAI